MERKRTAVYRQRLVDMRQRLIQEVQATEEGIRQDIAAPGEHGAIPTHPGDHDAEGLLENLAIAQNEEHLLEEVERALARIDAGRFGACQDCGQQIGDARLDAVPYTPWCIDCARRHETEAAAD